jgi:hypothetical protein
MEIVRIATYIVVLLLWGIIGFICWIPLLFRATASMAAAILYCTITETDPRYMRNSFESAVNFYARGFKIIEQIYSPSENSLKDESKDKRGLGEKWWKVLLEMCWTVIFWGGIFLLVSNVFLKPAKTDLEAIAAYQIPTRFRLGTSGSSWSRIDSTTWVETLPDGKSNNFRVVERAIVDNVQGTILRRNPDNLDVFIPDINSSSKLVKWRRQGEMQWTPLREMVDVVRDS